jgi:adenylate kinase family enzyme
MYWRAGWVEPPNAEWLRTVQQLLAGERWILDGNYGGTLGARLAACDTVVFLDLPRMVCLRNVIARRLKHLRGGRFDVAPGCPERLTWSFLYWIWTYPARRRSQILGLLSNLRPDQRAVVLRSRSEVSRFLKTLE